MENRKTKSRVIRTSERDDAVIKAAAELVRRPVSQFYASVTLEEAERIIRESKEKTA